jgi:hypothetical protein
LRNVCRVENQPTQNKNSAEAALFIMIELKK